MGEFILRFLNGGVFEIGGLYHWADEIRAKIYGNTNPYKIKPLLGVFYQCLELGLITSQDVIDRANWIISTEDAPHHFFTELSLSRDLNELLTVLNSIHLTEDILQIRVVFGVVNLQFLIDKMTFKKALSVLAKFVNKEGFTSYEVNEMRYLIEEWEYLNQHSNKTLQKQLDNRIKMFFDNYSRFNLYYHKHWNDINAQIIKDFLIWN